MASSFTFSKHEKLCSTKIIEKVFQGKKVLHLFPFSIYYQFCDLPHTVPVQVAFGVSKKFFKKAVDRNKVKRLMREAFRMNKATIYQAINKQQLAIIIVYHAKKILPYKEVEKSWTDSLTELKKIWL
jgi:ribonuclease P protein component